MESQPPFALEDWARCDAVIGALYAHWKTEGGSREAFLEACVFALAKQKAELIRELAETKAIAPQRMRLASGECRIFRVPADLIPITDLEPKPSERAS